MGPMDSTESGRVVGHAGKWVSAARECGVSLGVEKVELEPDPKTPTTGKRLSDLQEYLYLCSQESQHFSIYHTKGFVGSISLRSIKTSRKGMAPLCGQAQQPPSPFTSPCHSTQQ